MKLEGKAKMLRIHFGEDDRWQGRTLYEAIVERCRELDIAGATVFRGIQGYGASTRIRRSHLLQLSRDAPILVQIIDTRENIQRLIPALDEMVPEGLIAMSDVEVIKYVHQEGTASAVIMSAGLYLRSESEQSQPVTAKRLSHRAALTFIEANHHLAASGNLGQAVRRD